MAPLTCRIGETRLIGRSAGRRNLSRHRPAVHGVEFAEAADAPDRGHALLEGPEAAVAPATAAGVVVGAPRIGDVVGARGLTLAAEAEKAQGQNRKDASHLTTSQITRSRQHRSDCDAMVAASRCRLGFGPEVHRVRVASRPADPGSSPAGGSLRAPPARAGRHSSGRQRVTVTGTCPPLSDGTIVVVALHERAEATSAPAPCSSSEPVKDGSAIGPTPKAG